MAETADTPAAPPSDPLTERALDVLRTAHPEAVVASELGGRHPWIQVRVEDLRAACRLLRDHDELRMDCCHLISGVDWPEAGEGGEIEVVYHSARSRSCPTTRTASARRRTTPGSR